MNTTGTEFPMVAPGNSRKLRQQISELRRIDLARANIDFIKSQLLHILNGHLLSGPGRLPIEQRIYRAVQWQERPTHVRQLTYPPAEFVRTPQRMNREGQPVFYGSASFVASMLELGLRVTSTVAIATWVVRSNVTVGAVGYSKSHFEQHQCLRWADIPWLIEQERASETPRGQIIYKFLADEMTKKVAADKSFEYKITIALAESLLLARHVAYAGVGRVAPVAGPAMDGLAYPSVAMTFDADNVALTPDAADRALQCIAVQYLELTPQIANPEAFNIRPLAYSNKIEGGEIIWSDSFPQELIPGSDYQLSFENDAMVVRDHQGTIKASKAIMGEAIDVAQ